MAHTTWTCVRRRVRALVHIVISLNLRCLHGAHSVFCQAVHFHPVWKSSWSRQSQHGVLPVVNVLI